MCVCVLQVCELDIIFNFEKAYFILDEFVIGGEVQETSKASVAKSMEEADSLQEVTHTHAHTHTHTHFLMRFITFSQMLLHKLILSA